MCSTRMFLLVHVEAGAIAIVTLENSPVITVDTDTSQILSCRQCFAC